MTDETNREAIGGNNPPLAEMITEAYSPIRLAAEQDALGQSVHDMALRAGVITTVATPDDSAAATAMVIELRTLIRAVDETKDAVKAPILTAGRNIDGFFNGLNNSDTKKPGILTRHKVRLEAEVRDYGFRVAAEERRLAREAAERERERAEAEAAEAARLEALNKPTVATVVMDQAVKSEKFAEKFEARATGAVQDLARTRSAAGVAGLRAVPGFEIADRDALKATMGPLGNCFTADAVMAAVRKFRTDGEAYGKWAFRDDDQDAQKRIVVAVPPLAGVEFFISYEGSVRA